MIRSEPFSHEYISSMQTSNFSLTLHSSPGSICTAVSTPALQTGTFAAVWLQLTFYLQLRRGAAGVCGDHFSGNSIVIENKNKQNPQPHQCPISHPLFCLQFSPIVIRDRLVTRHCQPLVRLWLLGSTSLATSLSVQQQSGQVSLS